jgi:BirA family biotin operon repressor/biotin-[acetyl-CoA-carboxylase] ligase
MRPRRRDASATALDLHPGPGHFSTHDIAPGRCTRPKRSAAANSRRTPSSTSASFSRLAIGSSDTARLSGVHTDGRDPLDAAALRSALVGPGLGWRQLDVVTETGSTNADLLARAAAGEYVDGAVLIAEHQTAGRGRHGRTWSAPPRSLIAMSVGASVGTVPPDAWGWLPLLTGVAVVDAVLQECGIQAGLKWPNDVLVGGSKLAGILAEVYAPAAVVVVGLGLNVTMTADEAPDPAATSLQMLGFRVTHRNGLVLSILRALGSRIERWSSAGGPDDALVADYRRCSLTLGTEVKATMPGDRQVVGIARSIDELGRLRIDTGDAIVTVSAGDIAHLRPLRRNAPG